jgi:hypothetical protein
VSEKVIELARKAYAKLRNDDDNQMPDFDDLPSSIKHQYIEIADKGGDASVFGKYLTEVLEEENSEVKDGGVNPHEPQTDEESASGENGNDESGEAVSAEPHESQTDEEAAPPPHSQLDDTEAELMRHTRDELLGQARQVMPSVPADSTKKELVKIILGKNQTPSE